MPRFSAVLVLVTAPLVLLAGDDNVRKELKALQGTWKVVGLEAGGKPFPKEMVIDFTFIVGADGKSIGKMANVEYQATIRVDPGKNPRTIDNVHDTGAQKGKKQFGIYKLEGNRWTVCMTPPGAVETDRPRSFDTKDTTNVVFIFERVKADKKP
jgi:uncharacterized protein (TIGR03067 family)